MTRVRTLIVDDSPTMQRLIRACLIEDPSIEVVGTASDPYEAREAIKALSPDVITLDVEMPRMDGISFLEKIMRLRPTPVIMVSTLTHKGAAASVQALSMGAFECVGKPNPAEGPEGFSKLRTLVKQAGKSRAYKAGHTASTATGRIQMTPNRNIIAIGSSTGGVEALVTVMSRFPENCPPTVITQHMPPNFTASLAERLNRASGARVEEAQDGMPLEIGRVYLAPGGSAHLEVVRRAQLCCQIKEGPLVNGHCPSVDTLFHSVAKACGRHASGVILTGMGKDGAAGLKAMRDLGCPTIGQDEDTCVVYGMPRVAFEIGAVAKQVPISEVARAILRTCDQKKSRPAA
ncbi:MAG: chemotaxis response regulator protein-glutamate methylesterase [Pseudomonadota bacterium]